MSKGRAANNARSNSMNPNNSAYGASQVNRANQLNPQQPAYASSRSGGSSHGTVGGWGFYDGPEARVPPTLNEVIAAGRREVDEGSMWGEISGVEARLREKDVDALRHLVASFANSVLSLGKGWVEAAADQTHGDLIELVWTMIKHVWVAKGEGTIQGYLRSDWIPAYVPEGLPRRPVDPEEERRRYYDWDDDDD